MPTASHVRLLTSGDTALVVEFGTGVDRHVSALVLALADRIDAVGIEGILETVPTFRSLMVHYDPLRLRQAQLKERLRDLLQDLHPSETAGRLWRIPACYDPSLGPDLEEVARRTDLTPTEVVSLHSSETYHVYMLGFLPGFPYMGDLPAQLVLPRREDPRIKVPPGSLAIAMRMAAIYPLESPGGWHLLGRTPVPIWDLRRNPPALLMPGDKVKFDPIPLDEYDALVAHAQAGTLRTEPEPASAAGAAR
ncbi:MAG: 5-oxoprolinase subunit PxpB [Hyphomicrobiaceae bacterium]|nr:5-oxoprolinase subunit PxpB [Hyphomicrobiaceae bacterium]